MKTILHFLKAGKDWGSYYEYESRCYRDVTSTMITDNMKPVQPDNWFTEEISTNSLPDAGLSKLLHFNFEDKLKDKDGVYVVKIQDTERYYISDSKLVSLSDIGIISKEDKHNIYVLPIQLKRQHLNQVLKFQLFLNIIKS